MLNNILNSMSNVEIKEDMLEKITIIRENGDKIDIPTYIKTLLIEALEEVMGGDKDERNL